MRLKHLISFFSILSFLNISAQQTFGTDEIEFDGSQDVALLELDYSEISNSNGFNYYATNLGSSERLYPDSNNLLIAENMNRAELENYLNMMLRRRHPLEKTGRILTYVGVPLAIIGGIMVAGADELYYNCVNGNCTGDARGGFGVVLLGAGSGLSITGAVLWIVGSKK